MKHRIINTYYYIETLLAKQYIVFCIISENILCLLSGHCWGHMFPHLPGRAGVIAHSDHIWSPGPFVFLKEGSTSRISCRLACLAG